MRGSPIIHQAINLLPGPDRRCGGRFYYVVRRIDDLGSVVAPYSNPRVNTHDTISSLSRRDHLMQLQLFRLESRIAFVVIALINASRINFSAVDIVSQSSFEYIFNLNISDGAALHSKKIIIFFHLAPINDHMKFSFENEIQPNSSNASIAFPEGGGRYSFLHTFLRSRQMWTVAFYQC